MSVKIFKILPIMIVALLTTLLVSCGESDTESEPTPTVPTPTEIVSSLKQISSFSFQAEDNSVLNSSVSGVIDNAGYTIALTVPFGTSVDALIATFSDNAETVTVNDVTQVSGTTMNDFSSPVTFVAVAEDQTTQEYTVTVTVVSSDSAKDISAFSLLAENNSALNEDIDCTVNNTNNTIEAMVPTGTDLTSLVASFVTTATSIQVGGVNQSSGSTANDFSSSLVYLATAADDSTKNYTVTITETPEDLKDITSLTFTAAANNALSSDINATVNGDNTITATVPYGTDLSALIATFETTGESVSVGGTVQVSGTTANDFSGTVTYTATAVDGSTIDYEVTLSEVGGDAPLAVTFVDQVNSCANFGGYISITKAPDESELTHYVVYFGSSETDKLGKITEIPVTNENISQSFAASEGYTYPANHFIVVGKKSSGEETAGVAVQIVDLWEPNYDYDESADVMPDLTVGADKDTQLGLIGGFSIYINNHKVNGTVADGQLQYVQHVSKYFLYFGSDENTIISGLAPVFTSPGNTNHALENAQGIVNLWGEANQDIVVPTGATHLILRIKYMMSGDYSASTISVPIPEDRTIPLDPPASMSLGEDVNLSENTMSFSLTYKEAADTSNILGYHLFLGSDATTKNGDYIKDVSDNFATYDSETGIYLRKNITTYLYNNTHFILCGYNNLGPAEGDGCISTPIVDIVEDDDHHVPRIGPKGATISNYSETPNSTGDGRKLVKGNLEITPPDDESNIDYYRLQACAVDASGDISELSYKSYSDYKYMMLPTSNFEVQEYSKTLVWDQTNGVYKLDNIDYWTLDPLSFPQGSAVVPCNKYGCSEEKTVAVPTVGISP